VSSGTKAFHVLLEIAWRSVELSKLGQVDRSAALLKPVGGRVRAGDGWRPDLAQQLQMGRIAGKDACRVSRTSLLGGGKS
jgi:hypothetical protein